MHLEWLELSDFRSYSHLEYRPDRGVNVLVGPNGAGKTSVLEGVAYLSLLRSFRGVVDAALVRDTATGAIIRGGFARESGELRVEAELPLVGRRRILVNGKRPARFRDVGSQIPVVAFLPDDLDLVKRGPSLRREYLDDLAAQVSPAAVAGQAEYQRALRQRNALLRQDPAERELTELATWDQQVAAAGGAVVEHRLAAMRQLTPHLRTAVLRLGAGSDLSIEYESSWISLAQGINAADAAESLSVVLKERRQRDLAQRTTTAGPHRDDLGLILDGRQARTQASQGEQRSVALALRLAAYQLIEERLDVVPVLLLDDILSELDMARAAAVMELLPRGQVFVTSARDDDLDVDGVVWTVADAAVTRAA